MRIFVLHFYFCEVSKTQFFNIFMMLTKMYLLNKFMFNFLWIFLEFSTNLVNDAMCGHGKIYKKEGQHMVKTEQK